jgi:Trk K+ transport system NAD-binding subunit
MNVSRVGVRCSDDHLATVCGGDNAEVKRMRQPGRPRPILIAVLLAPSSLLLGFFGYRSLPGPPPAVTDALYSSLQLFTVGGSIPAHGTPWQLDVARFLAPLAVVYAAIVAAVSLVRNQAERVVVAARARDHILVIGLGATGAAVARGLRQHHQVVALEVDPHSSRISSARADGVQVLIGDGSNTHFLAQAQVVRARHVVVMTADDSRNLAIAAALREFLAVRRRDPITIHVAVANLDLWKELSHLQVAAARNPTVTEYLNVADRTAQRVVTAACAITREMTLSHVYIHGNSSMALRAVVHTARLAALHNIETRIEVGEEDLLQRVRDEEPWCRPYLMKSGTRELPPAPLALVCTADNDDAGAITRGLMLARQFPAAIVVVAVYRERSETTLLEADQLASRVHLVSAKLDALGQELLVGPCRK